MKIKVLYVTAQKHLFCIDVSYIGKIIQLGELQILPGAADDVAGALNFHGKIIPVFDLAILMGVGRSTPYSLNTSVVICSDQNHHVGMIVDEINELNEIDNEVFSSESCINSTGTYLNSIITINDLTIMVPEMKKIISRKIELEKQVV